MLVIFMILLLQRFSIAFYKVWGLTNKKKIIRMVKIGAAETKIS